MTRSTISIPAAIFLALASAAASAQEDSRFFFEAGGAVGATAGASEGASRSYSSLGVGGGLSLTPGLRLSRSIQLVGRGRVSIATLWRCPADAACWNFLARQQFGLGLGLRVTTPGGWIFEATGNPVLARWKWRGGTADLNWGASGALFVGKTMRARSFDWVLGAEARLDHFPIMDSGGFAHLDLVAGLRWPRTR